MFNISQIATNRFYFLYGPWILSKLSHHCRDSCLLHTSLTFEPSPKRHFVCFFFSLSLSLLVSSSLFSFAYKFFIPISIDIDSTHLSLSNKITKSFLGH